MGLDFAAMGGSGHSVYGELKLSEKLADELQVSRALVAELREELEDVTNVRDRYKRELDETQAELSRYQKELQSQKKEIWEIKHRSKQTAIESE